MDRAKDDHPGEHSFSLQWSIRMRALVFGYGVG